MENQDFIFNLLQSFSHLDVTELPTWILEMVNDLIDLTPQNMGEGSLEHSNQIGGEESTLNPNG